MFWVALPTEAAWSQGLSVESLLWERLTGQDWTLAMAVVANRAPSNPAFWLVAPVPEGFAVGAESDAPLSGEVVLPVHLWWSDSHASSLDMADPDTRAFVYERVLTNGTAEDVVAWIHPSALVEAWERMLVTVPVAERWQPWIEEQCR